MVNNDLGKMPKPAGGMHADKNSLTHLRQQLGDSFLGSVVGDADALEEFIDDQRTGAVCDIGAAGEAAICRILSAVWDQSAIGLQLRKKPRTFLLARSKSVNELMSENVNQTTPPCFTPALPGSP